MDGEQAASPKSPTILFAGGGTGGHLYPGIAVAEQWVRQFPASRILFVGTDRAVERRIAQANGLEHVSIPFEPPSRALRHPWSYWRKLRKSNRIVGELFRGVRPDVVIGLGSYSSVPAVLQARRAKIPIVLLEQNSIPGRANRFLSRFADHICLTYEDSIRYFPPRIPATITGNPLRAEVTRLREQRAERRGKPVLLITGGSQGARFLNDLLIEFAREHGSALSDWHIRHQAGTEVEADRIRAEYDRAGLSADVRAYFDTPAELYEQVALAVTRAGATTLAELAWLRIPALIIPLASSVNNHQLYNANCHVRFSCSQVMTEHQTQAVGIFNMSLSRLLNTAIALENEAVPPDTSSNEDASVKVASVISRILRLG